MYYEEEPTMYYPRLPQMTDKEKKKAMKALAKSIGYSKGINVTFGRWFYLSVMNKKSCLYSRRTGQIGKLIFGYSVMLRIFNWDII